VVGWVFSDCARGNHRDLFTERLSHDVEGTPLPSTETKISELYLGDFQAFATVRKAGSRDRFMLFTVDQ